MSNIALTWARSLDAYWNRLPKGVDQVKAAFMLHILCDAANDDLLVWLAAETIAQRTRIRSRNTIAKYLGHLEDLGLIHDTGQRRRVGSSDRGGAKTYRILADPDPAARRDCSLHTEQSPPAEIAQSIVSNLPGATVVEIAQSEGEIAQYRGGDCSLQSEHEARKLRREAAARARGRAGAREAAADFPISSGEYRPPPEITEAVVAERPELAGHLPAVVAAFQRHGWKRRRTAEQWHAEFRRWCAHEELPEPAGGKLEPGWAHRRVAVLLRHCGSESWLSAQLEDDPAMAALFADAGGAAAVARMDPATIDAEYRRLEARAPPEPHARHGPKPIRLVDDPDRNQERSA